MIPPHRIFFAFYSHFSAIKYKKASYKLVQITGNIELSGNHDFLISKSTHPQDIQ